MPTYIERLFGLIKVNDISSQQEYVISRSSGKREIKEFVWQTEFVCPRGGFGNMKMQNKTISINVLAKVRLKIIF